MKQEQFSCKAEDFLEKSQKISENNVDISEFEE